MCNWGMSFGLQKLECSKPVIVAGDLNCARQSIDIHNPQVSLFAQHFINKFQTFCLLLFFLCGPHQWQDICALLDATYIFSF